MARGNVGPVNFLPILRACVQLCKAAAAAFRRSGRAFAGRSPHVPSQVQPRSARRCRSAYGRQERALRGSPLKPVPRCPANRALLLVCRRSTGGKKCCCCCGHDVCGSLAPSQTPCCALVLCRGASAQSSVIVALSRAALRAPALESGRIAVVIFVMHVRGRNMLCGKPSYTAKASVIVSIQIRMREVFAFPKTYGLKIIESFS